MGQGACRSSSESRSAADSPLSSSSMRSSPWTRHGAVVGSFPCLIASKHLDFWRISDSGFSLMQGISRWRSSGRISTVATRQLAKYSSFPLVFLLYRVESPRPSTAYKVSGALVATGTPPAAAVGLALGFPSNPGDTHQTLTLLAAFLLSLGIHT